MPDWSLGDTAEIPVVSRIALSTARAVDGIAPAIVALVGVVTARLWTTTSFCEGVWMYDRRPKSTTDRFVSGESARVACRVRAVVDPPKIQPGVSHASEECVDLSIE